MTDEDAFIQALLAAPGDTSVRLVYADWLDERGECPRAEYLRLLVRMDTATTADPLTDEAIERLRRLERQIDLRWLGLVNRGRIRKRQQPDKTTGARGERRRSRGEVLEAQIGVFLRQYARRSKYCSGPNDRSYNREVENKVQRMDAEYFDRLLRGDEN
jgi:uncharacterized protein (TIGR02996 family)